MVSVPEATNIILSNLHTPEYCDVPLTESVGQVLGESVTADRDFPPFNRVAMDGIAISFDDFVAGNTSFPIEAIQPAGTPQKEREGTGTCLEVMTGAILPANTDTVVRYEDVTIDAGVATLTIRELTRGQHIHGQGTDVRKGDVVLHSPCLLSAAEIAVLASVGQHSVRCRKFPSIAIVATGDELVPVEQVPELHQIRSSNSHALKSALYAMHVAADTFHIKDDEHQTESELLKLLEDHDVLIISGGVSNGKFDFIPAALEKSGIEKKFHGVRQRPGKPFWFGTGGGKTVFALPGNPVSTYMCFYRYVKPWLLSSLGVTEMASTAILAADFSFLPPLTHFLQVYTVVREGKLIATPVTGKGSGDFANLNKVTGFLELPEGKIDFKAGESFPYFPFRPF